MADEQDIGGLVPFTEDGGRLIRRVVSGIYQIRNIHTGRVYIGKSRDIAGRWLAHRSALNRGVHINDDFQGDWEAYGERAFEFTILEEVTGFAALQNAEARHFRAANAPYNVAQIREREEVQGQVDKEASVRQFLWLMREAFYNYDPPGPVVIQALTGIPASARGDLMFRVASDYAVFQDHGYMGLYNGERARDIHTRKGLAKSQHILDHMGSEELAANLFRATQTEAKLQRERDQIPDKNAANQAHFEVGRKVRSYIADLGGTMPEELPTPAESI